MDTRKAFILSFLVLLVFFVVIISAGCSKNEPPKQGIGDDTSMSQEPEFETPAMDADDSGLDSETGISDDTSEDEPESETADDEDEEIDEDDSPPPAEKPKPQPPKKPEKSQPKVLYKVIAGLFYDKPIADNLVKDLRADGFDALIQTVSADGKKLYRVQTGAFSSKQNAQKQQAHLKEKGYETDIIEVKT